MTLQIYKFTMFIICVSIGIQFIELSNVVCSNYNQTTGDCIDTTHSAYADKYTNSINKYGGNNGGIYGYLTGYVSYLFGTSSTTPSGESDASLTYGVLLLATFSLLILSLPFMVALFWFGYSLTADIILKLPLDGDLQTGLILLLAIIYMVGYQQYKSTTVPTLDH